MLILLALFSLILFVSIHAQTTVFNIEQNGAKADGISINTKAIQLTIDECGNNNGGGIILVPGSTNGDKPNIFVTGSIWLASNCTLRVETNAILQGVWGGWNKTYEYYPATFLHYDNNNGLTHAALINGAKCTKVSPDTAAATECAEWTPNKLLNVRIDGGGIIDGNGSNWWLSQGILPDGSSNNQRPMLMSLHFIDYLEISNITASNSAFWTIHPTFCNHVHIDNIYVYSPPYPIGHNTDGVDPDGCTDVTIRDCLIDNGDDAIAVFAGSLNENQQYPSQHILIINCTFIHSHGATLGPYIFPYIDNVTFKDITMIETMAGPHMKGRCNNIYRQDEPGRISNVIYDNFTLYNVTYCANCVGWDNITGSGIVIDMPHNNGDTDMNDAVCPNDTLIFDNITFRNIQNMDNAIPNYSWWLQGLLHYNVTGLVLQNIDLPSQNNKQFCQNANIVQQENIKPNLANCVWSF